MGAGGDPKRDQEETPMGMRRRPQWGPEGGDPKRERGEENPMGAGGDPK